MNVNLELVPVPVSDVDGAKAFYTETASFKLEVDTRPTDTMGVRDMKGVRFADFSDSDGNLRLLQEFPQRTVHGVIRQ